MAGRRDPFDGLVLDDDFVEAARWTEVSVGRVDPAHWQSRWATWRAYRRGLAHRSVFGRRSLLLARESRLGGRKPAAMWAGVAIAAVSVLVGLSLLPRSARPVEGAAGEVVLSSAARTWSTALHPTLVAGSSSRSAGGAVAPGLVGFDPCRPVQVVVNTDAAPSGAYDMVVAAAREVSMRSGLDVVVEGLTGEAASVFRDPYEHLRYGDRWSPVLVGWSDDVNDVSLAGAVDHVAANTSASIAGGHPYLVSGVVIVDGPQIAVVDDPRAVTRAALLSGLWTVVGADQLTDVTARAELGRIACAPLL